MNKKEKELKTEIAKATKIINNSNTTKEEKFVTYFSRGNVKVELGQHEAAIEDCNKLLQYSKKNTK